MAMIPVPTDMVASLRHENQQLRMALNATQEDLYIAQAVAYYNHQQWRADEANYEMARRLLNPQTVQPAMNGFSINQIVQAIEHLENLITALEEMLVNAIASDEAQDEVVIIEENNDCTVIIEIIE